MKTTPQRDGLKRSEKKASVPQPENFKDRETDDRTVEIGPDLTDSPIHGIDPPQRKPAKRVRAEESSKPTRDGAGDHSEARRLTPAVLRVLEWHRQRAEARAQDGS
jgi:hypothetical protein